MKRVLILLLCVLLCGCSSSKVEVNKYDIKEYLADSSDQYEILDVDSSYIYINTHEGNEGLLYDTKNILVLNHDGSFYKEFEPLSSIRILDYIIWNNESYYFTLKKDDNNYLCELMKEDMIINQWILSDPYNYPTFHVAKDRVFYRVDNFLYSLDSAQPFIDDTYDWLFGIEEPHTKTISYKILNDEGLYDIYRSDNEGEPIYSHQYIGEFYVDDEYVVFRSRKNMKLYAYSLNTKKLQCIYDEEVDDFIVNHHYIAVSTAEEIVILDQSFDTVGSVDKDKYNVSPIHYIYKLDDSFYIISDDGYVLDIGVKE